MFLFLALCQPLRAQSWEAELERYDREATGKTLEENLGILKSYSREYASDSSALGAIYRRMGIKYAELGSYQEAIDYQLKALAFAHRGSDFLGRASSLNNIAGLYYTIGNEELAREYFLEAYQLFGKAGKEKKTAQRGQSDMALNLAQLYFDKGEYTEAEHFLSLSFQHLYAYGDTAEINYLYLLEAALHERKNDPDAALRTLLKVRSNLEKMPDPTVRLMMLQNKASIHTKKGETDSVLVLLQEALQLAYEIENVDYIRNTANELSRFYEARGDSLNAFQYLKIYRVFNDSLLDASRIKAMIEAEQRYRSQEKTREVEQKELELKKKRYQVLFMGTLCLLLLAGSVLLVKNRNKARRLAESALQLKDARIKELMSEQELKSIDSMLKGQDEERRRIARELHDRLGSILATIKLHFSVMEEEIQRLQERQLQSYEMATSMLDEAVDEVRKISHDLHSGSISKFGLKAALGQLILAIETANAVRIQFMDNGLEPAIYEPYEVELYRITQELLSNTLKHAGATEVSIQLNRSEGFLTYSYEDNGRGFDKAILAKSDGLGMLSIEARVKKINGHSTLDSMPGHGFTFIVEIPL